MEQPHRPELWVLGIMPDAWKVLPEEIIDASRKGRVIALVEEHVAHGGAGQALITELVARGATPKHFKHFCAAGYPSGKYGSQSFHRRESGIDVESVLFRLLTEGIAR
jgi:transketolase